MRDELKHFARQTYLPLSPQIRLGWSEDVRNEVVQDSALHCHVQYVQTHTDIFV